MSENEENRDLEEGEEREDQDENGEEKVEDEDENVVRLRELEQKFVQDIKENLSNISKIQNNGSYAYIKLNLAEKEIEKLFNPLLNYRHLRYLDLSGNQISDISLVTQLPFLLSLNCSKNQISSLQQFNPAFDEPALKYLQFLNVSGNKLTKLEKLRLPQLRKLDVSENEIASAEEFGGHPKLEFLNMNINKLKDLKGIQDCPKLRELNLEENEIADIRDLKNLPSLYSLNLRKNNIKRLRTPIPALTKLYNLNISENVIEDFKEIYKIGKLRNVYSFNYSANPCCDTVANARIELLVVLDYFEKLNDEDVTPDDLQERLNTINEREEARKQAEEEARLAAEEQARQEEEARKEAEELARQEEEARKEAEEQARLEEEARLEEQRLADEAAKAEQEQQQEAPNEEQPQ